MKRTLLLLLALGLGGCGERPCVDGATGADRQRQLLNEGYSILRHDARTISSIGLLLLVKVESDEFEAVVQDAAAFGARLKGDLDRLAREYPALQVDLDPLPVLEQRKRVATGWDKFKDIAPLTGKSGMAYERLLLISLSNGLNQERHLVSEMAEEEPDPQLREFLGQTRKRMDQLHEAAIQLLEQRYFVQES